MSPAVRRWVRPVRFLLAALLLTWLFSRIPLSGVAAVLGRAAVVPLLAGAAASLAALVVASLRLRLVARHHGFDLGAREACAINFAATFYGLTVPGGNIAGGAVRIFRLGSARPMPALAAVFADRVHATFGTLLVGCLFWLADASAGPPALGLALFGITAAVPVVYLLFRAGSPLARRLPEKWRRALGREAEVAPAETLRVVGLTMVAQVLGFAAVLAAAAALGLDVPAATLGWVRTAVMLVVMLPISVAGFGVREGALVAILARYGVPGAEAVAFSLLVFGVTTLANGIVGGVVEALRLLRRGSGDGAPLAEPPHA